MTKLQKIKPFGHSKAPKKEKKEKRQPSVNREGQNKIKKLKFDLEKAEQKIEKLEAKKNKIEEEMADPSVFGNPDKLMEKSMALETVNQELAPLHESWENLALEIDELEG